MSDIDMTADTGAAEVAPALAPEPVATPKPVETGSPTEAPVEKAAEEKATADKAAKEAKPEKPVSTRDALKAAAEKVEKDEKAPPVKAEPKPKTEPEKEAATRGPDGKFASKEPAQAETAEQPPAAKSEPTGDHREPPQRFNDAAKAEWANVPETTRAEVHRAIRNIESGLEKHRAAAESYEPVRAYDEFAKANGTTLKAALDVYWQIEQDLQLPSKGGNPIPALEKLCETKGYTLQQVAEMYLKRTPDQRSSQQEQTITTLRNEIAQLKQQFGNINQVVGGFQQQSASGAVEAFVSGLPESDKSAFEALSSEIASEITNNRLNLPDAFAKAKSDAQEKAARLGFIAPASQPAPAAADLTAHRQNGSRSISGAPSPGSSSVAQKPSSSTREALRKAFAAANA